MTSHFRDPRATAVPRSSVWVRAGYLPLCVAAHALRLTAFAILSTLEPVVRITLTLLALGGFATCVLYGYVLHAPHFPFGEMLLFSIALAVLSVLYRLVVRGLAL